MFCRNSQPPFIITRNFQIFPEHTKRIRLYAAQNNLKVSEVVRRALDEFFEDKGI